MHSYRIIILSTLVILILFDADSVVLLPLME
jgi:hypothetical protein